MPVVKFYSWSMINIYQRSSGLKQILKRVLISTSSTFLFSMSETCQRSNMAKEKCLVLSFEAQSIVEFKNVLGALHLNASHCCTTGLKDLADYLPATLATIVSYFSAEVTRGVWKSVFMNGTDWPSPAANLSNVEEQIKKILAATGVDVPSLAAGLL